jgi:hypothetical protein
VPLLSFRQVIMLEQAAPTTDAARSAFIAAVMRLLPEQPHNADIAVAVGKVLTIAAPAISSFGNSEAKPKRQREPLAVR